ncbi:hypothetical protein ABL78_7828 [Leptomonas seymouri]|uniref:N-acetyltransferase domain-containing protein n=1 Tax=Leptomonas seymouri TaxID=5684 RepID=A0A0N1HYZ5_LEPSE|nr:hypothetical protein ABL78_7828 [Leptomonas seymouri]|eukprot:KPI83150.1 hypothetical protein ABL78_7828 [Leptomonas seymouri]
MDGKAHSLPEAAATQQRAHRTRCPTPTTSAPFSIVPLTDALLPLLEPVEAASYPASYCEGVAGYAKRLHARPASSSFVCLQCSSAQLRYAGISDLVAAGDFARLRAIGYAITCRLPRRTASLLVRGKPKDHKNIQGISDSSIEEKEQAVVDNHWTMTPLIEEEDCLYPSSHGADTLYIHDVAVHPDCRGLGVAGALWKHIEQARVELQLKRMSLVAVFGASTYWARYGFREVERKALQEATVRVLEDYGDHAVFMEWED